MQGGVDRVLSGNESPLCYNHNVLPQNGLCLEVLTKAGQAPSRVPNSPAKRENIGSQSRFC